MHFESLANELVLDLFEYLDGIYLFRAFNGLNSRLNSLLFLHYRSFSFDFRSKTKSDFDVLCKYYFPLIINRIKSFNLSNNDETPNLPELFSSYGFTLNQFVGLRSLSFDSIESVHELNQLIIQCQHLPYLTHLNIIHSHIDGRKKEINDFLNHIWGLPKLYSLNLTNNQLGKVSLKKISIVSLTIQKLSIENVSCSLADLAYLIKQTPNVERLSITIHWNAEDEQILLAISSIKSLKLTFESSIPILMKLFQMMPHLISLKIKITDIYFNGYQWKRILRNYLQNLQFFQFRMYFEFRHRREINDEFEKLIRTYQTPFWIEKHRWFITCDCIMPFDGSYHGIVYSLPYSFDQFICYNTVKSKSTCSNDTNYSLANQVKQLQYLNFKTNTMELSTRFPRIRYLKTAIPFDDYFWFSIPSLDRLHSLEVMLGQHFSYEQLQSLIHFSPNLYSLRIYCSFDLKNAIIQLTSSSIRRLNLIQKCRKAYFNSEECTNLACSPLGQQCEALLIKIEDRKDALDLIRTMSNLRSFLFQCQDDRWNEESSTSSNEDEFLQWLRLSLPSSYLINRDKNELSNIRIWIGENRKMHFYYHKLNFVPVIIYIFSI